MKDIIDNECSFLDIITNLNELQNSFRPIPFWSWNDKLNESELKRQVREQKKAGLGGFFMHARNGLKTKYMGKKWMQSVKSCIEEGKKYKIKSWLYDENGWPSGSGGGAVPKLGDDYRQQYLVFEKINKKDLTIRKSTLGLFKLDGDFCCIDNLNSIEDDKDILHIYYDINSYYVDLLNEKVVGEFIKSTYEAYYDKFKDDFGSNIPGIFTDEPQYGRYKIVWSSILPERFEKKYGYSIIEKLNALYSEIDGFEKIRYDYWEIVTELYTNAYAKQIAVWCKAHNIKLTGHVLFEESILLQILSTGSAMQNYLYYHIPGIDWLGRNIGNRIPIRQVASVAAQLGKTQVLSEMFAGTGWNVNFNDLKRIAEWQIAYGINLLCPHLQAYSLRGIRKKDWPPSIFYQMPAFGYYSIFNNYISKLCAIISTGREDISILVIHPLKSGYIAFDQTCSEFGCSGKISEIDENFYKLTDIIYRNGFACHYGDENILAQYAKIVNGKISVGNCSYDIVIIPPSLTIDVKTVDLLNEFANSSGIVISFENYFPMYCSGRRYHKEIGILQKIYALKEKSQELPFNEKDLTYFLCNKCRRTVYFNPEMQFKDSLHTQIRQYNDGYLVYIFNDSIDKKASGTIFAVGLSNGLIIDIENDRCSKIMLNKGDTENLYNVELHECSSILIFLTDNEIDCFEADDIKSKLATSSVEVIELNQSWQAVPHNPNTLVLDFCKYKIDDGNWNEAQHTSLVMEKLLECEKDINISLQYELEAQSEFAGIEFNLVVEDPQDYEILINNVPLKNKPEGWWVDKSFKLIPFRNLIKKGVNTIQLNKLFRNSPKTAAKIKRSKEYESELNTLVYDSEIDSIYLLGNFVVGGKMPFEDSKKNTVVQQGGFVIKSLSTNLVTGSLTSEGYPFYRGEMSLKSEFYLYNTDSVKSVFLDLGKPMAAAVELHINGLHVNNFIWNPYSADITNYIKEGINSIEIVLVSTNRNLLGHHHSSHGELDLLALLFFRHDFGFTNSYRLAKFGLSIPPKLLIFK